MSTYDTEREMQDWLEDYCAPDHEEDGNKMQKVASVKAQLIKRASEKAEHEKTAAKEAIKRVKASLKKK